MTHKPYIYVMPEEFMADQSVPAQWRLLGLLNGFFVNNLDVYASNEWLSEQLKCSPRTITDAVAKLEELKKIDIIRTQTTRVIKRGGSNQLLGGWKPTARQGSNQLLPNSDSNSDSLKDFSKEKSSLPIIEVLETPPKPKRSPFGGVALKLRAEFYNDIGKAYGATPITSQGDYQRILEALKYGLAEEDLRTMMDDAIGQGKGRTVSGVFSHREVSLYKQNIS